MAPLGMDCWEKLFASVPVSLLSVSSSSQGLGSCQFRFRRLPAFPATAAANTLGLSHAVATTTAADPFRFSHVISFTAATSFSSRDSASLGASKGGTTGGSRRSGSSGSSGRENPFGRIIHGAASTDGFVAASRSVRHALFGLGRVLGAEEWKHRNCNAAHGCCCFG